MEYWALMCQKALLFMSCLVFHTESLEALLSLVVNSGRYPQEKHYGSLFSLIEQYWLAFYEFMTTGAAYREEVYVPSPPNKIASLLHWRVFGMLL